MLEPLQLLNVIVESLCVVICGILVVQQCTIHHCGTHKKRNSDRWFLFSIYSNIVMMLGDLCGWVFSGIQGTAARVALFAGSTLYFASSGVLMYSFFAYYFTSISEKAKLPKWMLIISRILMAAQAALSLSSPIFGTIFTYDSENVYQRGSLFLLSQLTAVIEYIVVAYMLVLGWKWLNVKERIYFLTYVIIILISEAVQVMIYGLPLLNVAFTLSFLLVSLFINSEIDEQFHRAEIAMEDERIGLLEELKQTSEKLTEQTIFALSNAVEAKDRYTSGHSRRVAEYSAEIVKRMGWDEQRQREVYYAGLLHDVGKIRVSDSVINKKGRLNSEEYEEIKLHPMSGYYILKEISSISDFAEGARWHHERYDGTGYPNGLVGEDIPIVARVIGVADAYDAMTSNRSYRAVMSQSEVRREIKKGIGTQFDPRAARIMLQMMAEDKSYKMRQSDISEVNRRILFVESGDDIYSLWDESLEADYNYSTRRASSVEGTIEVISRFEVSLVILDSEFPDGNVKILEWITRNHPNIPVIIATNDRSALKGGSYPGVADCLTKPFTKHMLTESVQNILQNYSKTHHISGS